MERFFYVHPVTTCLRYAARDNQLSAVNFLLRGGASPKDNNSTALQAAAENGHIEIVKVLTEAGALVHDSCGAPLRVASCFGHLEIVKFLVYSGALANRRVNRDTRDALYSSIISASGNGHLDVVKYLVTIGLTRRTIRRSIAAAHERGHPQVVEYFLTWTPPMDLRPFEIATTKECAICWSVTSTHSCLARTCVATFCEECIRKSVTYTPHCPYCRQRIHVS